jgi:hypothetical protein
LSSAASTSSPYSDSNRRPCGDLSKTGKQTPGPSATAITTTTATTSGNDEILNARGLLVRPSAFTQRLIDLL